MKHRLLCACAGLLAAGLLLAGCFNPLGGQGEADSGEQGTVVLVFQDMRAKTLVPAISLQITRFQVSFTRTGFQPVVLDDIPGDTVETDAVSLLAGPWELTVMAFNEAGDLIGRGSDALQVRARQSARITLPILSLSGPGTLQLSADLSELQLLDPSISGTLTSGATQEVIPIQLGIESSLGLYEGSLEAGTYLLNLQLSEGQTVIAAYVDTVLIVQGLSTTGSLAFRPGSGSVVVELLDEITRPIPITLLGLVESLDSEQSMTVTASTVQQMEAYWWYLDGEQLPGEQSAQLTLGPGLEEGPYLLTVVVRKGSTYSSQQADFAVASGQSPAHTLTVSVTGSGSVSSDPDLPFYAEGSQVTLTAIPDPDWLFEQWSGDYSGSLNPLTVTMTGDRNLTASFVEDSYAIIPAGPGTIRVSEIMADPQGVLDTSGEWFEIVSRSAFTVDLSGVRVEVQDQLSFTISGDTLIMYPGDCVVIGINEDPATNGGVQVDYDWGTSSDFSIPNTPAALVLYTADQAVLDSVELGAATEGHSAYLASDDSWAVSGSFMYNAEDYGTPGLLNYDGQ